jgi:flagellar protein FlbD
MVTLHRLDGEEFDLNAWLVETVRSTPDTIVLLTNGHSLAVQEARDDVRQRIEAAMRRVMGPARTV